MTDIDTIFALSSGAGRAGIAVIRLSGPSALTSVKQLVGAVPAPRQASLRALRDPATAEIIDRGIVLVFPAPASFTGEDAAEFHLHGGRAVVRRFLAALAALPGCRLAEAGEFTKRALLNGKLDLPAVEGLADLIAADTEEQRKQALRQAEGVLGARAGAWRAGLLESIALIEAMIDFGEEDDVAAAGTLERFRQAVARVTSDIDHTLADGRRGERLRDGFRVVIAGPPNAGKSTLLNALAQRDVAIVSAEAGTTRDPIEISLDLDGLPVTVIDTAGIRAAMGEIEAQGVARALDRARAADLVLWLNPAGSSWQEPPASASVLRIASKIDSCPERMEPDCDLTISALTGQGLAVLIARLRSEAAEALADGGGLIVRERQRLCLAAASSSLNQALIVDHVELSAECLRQAIRSLGTLLGAVSVEETLDTIFSQFCIGK